MKNAIIGMRLTYVKPLSPLRAAFSFHVSGLLFFFFLCYDCCQTYFTSLLVHVSHVKQHVASVGRGRQR